MIHVPETLERELKCMVSENLIIVSTKIIEGKLTDTIDVWGGISPEHKEMYFQMGKGTNRSVMAHLKRDKATTIYIY